MKLVLVLTLLAVFPWPVVRPVSAHEIDCSARVSGARTLEVARGAVRSELTLADLSPEARIVAVEIVPYMESGVALGLSIALGDGFEYRYLLQREGDVGGERRVAGRPAKITDWLLSAPLFADLGAVYRIVDVHSPGGDTLELTFRRGVPETPERLDEVVVVDVCPGWFGEGGLAPFVQRMRATGRPL